MKIVNTQRLILLTWGFALLLTLLALAKDSSANQIPAQIEHKVTDPEVIQFLPDGETNLTIYADRTSISLIDQQGRQQTLINDVGRIPDHVYDIWLDDFNFDGYTDIAIATGESIDGLAEIYTLFCWRPDLGRVAPLSGLATISNPELIATHRELRSASRTGKHWSETSYRFTHGRPYVYSKSVMLSNQIWHTSTYTEQGQKVVSLISSDGATKSAPQPIVKPIHTEQAWLYLQPLPSSKTQEYLLRNVQVTILDYHEGRLDWVLIRTHGQHPVERWTLLSNLNIG